MKKLVILFALLVSVVAMGDVVRYVEKVIHNETECDAACLFRYAREQSWGHLVDGV